MNELLAEKRRLNNLLEKQKVRLGEQVDYLQRNAASIFVSTFSYHLILKQLPIIGDLIASKEKNNTVSCERSTAENENTLGLTPLQKTAKAFTLIWKIVKPVFFSIIIKRIQSFLVKKVKF